MVGRGARASHQSVNGRGVDDGAAANLAHFGDGVLGAQEHALGVDVHLAVPDVHGRVLDVCGRAGAGVVYNHVQPAVGGQRRLDGLLPVLVAGDVELHEDCVAAHFANLGGRPLALLQQDVGQDDLCALSREQPGSRAAEAHQLAFDSRGRAGNKSDLAFQAHRSPSLRRRSQRLSQHPHPNLPPARGKGLFAVTKSEQTEVKVWGRVCFGLDDSRYPPARQALIKYGPCR